MLRRKLIPLKFQICDVHQSDTITLSREIQNHFKEGFHVAMFVDRGLHAVARSAFVGKFDALVSSIRPRPRTLVLDGNPSLRLTEWDEAGSGSLMTINEALADVPDAATSSIALGNILTLSLA